ncbi:MAG: hypothetical protein Q9169_006315 [Polycauliona sp. 2 TL-2023]
MSLRKLVPNAELDHANVTRKKRQWEDNDGIIQPKRRCVRAPATLVQPEPAIQSLQSQFETGPSDDKGQLPAPPSTYLILVHKKPMVRDTKTMDLSNTEKTLELISRLEAAIEDEGLADFPLIVSAARIQSGLDPMPEQSRTGVGKNVPGRDTSYATRKQNSLVPPEGKRLSQNMGHNARKRRGYRRQQGGSRAIVIDGLPGKISSAGRAVADKRRGDEPSHRVEDDFAFRVEVMTFRS